jgi:hypothetical protein
VTLTLVLYSGHIRKYNVRLHWILELKKAHSCPHPLHNGGWGGKGESREWVCTCVCLCEFIYWKRLFCVDSIRAVTGSSIRNPNPHSGGDTQWVPSSRMNMLSPFEGLKWIKRVNSKGCDDLHLITFGTWNLSFVSYSKINRTFRELHLFPSSVEGWESTYLSFYDRFLYNKTN